MRSLFLPDLDSSNECNFQEWQAQKNGVEQLDTREESLGNSLRMSSSTVAWI